MVDLAKKRYPLKPFLILIGVVVVGTVGFLGWRKFEAKYEPPRLAKKAREYIDQHEYKKASLLLRRGVKLNPNDIACTDLMAEIGEAVGDPNAVPWRHRLVELQPNSLDAVLKCASSAILFQQLPFAEEVLQKASTLGRDRAEYHRLFSTVAVGLGKTTLAVEHSAEALRLEPGNRVNAVNYASALLARGWLEDRSAARARLNELKQSPELRVSALEALAKDSVANDEVVGAMETARELDGIPEVPLSDRILYLDLLRRTADSDLPAKLEAAQKSSRGHPDDVAALALWMNQNGRAEQTLQWAPDFSEEELASPKVRAAMAVAALTLKDWAKLEALTAGMNWGGLEHLRALLQARAYREVHKEEQFVQQWNVVARSVGAGVGHTQNAANLAKLTAEWGWNTQSEEMLRASLLDPMFGAWAARTVMPRLAEKKDTTNLWLATARIFEQEPRNDAAANNYAMYSLLLGRDMDRAVELAHKLYARHSREAKYVSTHAYALHVHGQTAAGLAALETLDDEALRTPDVAAYYGILAAAGGDPQKSREFLDLAANANLLPEESELIRRARRTLDEKSMAPAGQNTNAEFVRLANLAREYRARTDLASFRQNWDAAVMAAGKEPHGSAELAQYISDWGWETEYEVLLRNALHDFKNGAWAARTLLPRLAARKDTLGLLEANERLLESEPNNDEAALGFVKYTYLRERNTTRAGQLIPGLYERHRTDARYVCMYAYSLHVHNRTAEAVQAMESLGEATLQKPEVAVYYGIVLANTKETDKARHFLELGKTASLLPEETYFLKQAVAKVDAAATAK